jgi:hypothetical protein
LAVNLQARCGHKNAILKLALSVAFPLTTLSSAGCVDCRPRIANEFGSLIDFYAVDVDNYAEHLRQVIQSAASVTVLKKSVSVFRAV